jgi:23S rRNA (cytidine1920-2'-O)/16S rRNA (cytidine1409-2'-O)-methyltransferase
VDVAYGTLAWSLRNDPRVCVMERANARALTPEMLPFAPEVAVIDVSFISLGKVLGAVLGCMAPGYDALALVKPQFEVGRARVGKGGVVREPEHRRAALVGAGEAALALGAAVLGYHPSGLPGPKGNRETFLWLADPARWSGKGRASTWPTGPGLPVIVGATDERQDPSQASIELEKMAREVEA